MTVPVLVLAELPTAAHGPQGGFWACGRDLPGRRASAPADHPFTTAGPSRTVPAAVDGLTAEGEDERPFFCAGHSTGGCAGQQLLFDAPGGGSPPAPSRRTRPRPRPCGTTSARRTGPRAPGRPGGGPWSSRARPTCSRPRCRRTWRAGWAATSPPAPTAEGARA